METQTILPSTQTQELDSRRWLMLIVVLSAAIMVALDNYIVNIAIPSIEKQLQASFAEVQLVIAGYTLSYAVLLVTGGRLGDLYGRKRLFIIGVAGFTLFSTLCGLAPNAFLLIVFRIAKGVAAALMTPQVMAFIQVSFPPDERARAFGYYAALSGMASILGQVLGGFLLAINIFNLGWRSIFLVNVPIGIIALLAAWPLIRETRVQEARNLDYGGVILLTLSLFLLVFPLAQVESAGWSLWILLCLVLALPCMIAFLVYEQHITKQGKTPLLSLSLFQQRRFPAGIVTSALAGAFIVAATFLLPFYLQTTLRLTPLQAGFVFLPSSLAFILASNFSPMISRRLGSFILPIATALVTLAYLLIALAAQFFVPLWGLTPMLVALFVLGSGMGSLITPLMHKTLEGVAQSDVGVASGVYTTASQVSGAIGIPLIGLVFATISASTGDALFAFFISLLIIALLSLGLSLTMRPLMKPE